MNRGRPARRPIYDMSVGGKVHERAAWNYEAPQPKMRQVTDCFGSWEDVEVG